MMGMGDALRCLYRRLVFTSSYGPVLAACGGARTRVALSRRGFSYLTLSFINSLLSGLAFYGSIKFLDISLLPSGDFYCSVSSYLEAR